MKTIFALIRTRPRARWLFILLLWAALCAAFYWEVLCAPADQILAGNDLSNMFRLWLDYARSMVRAGELPLWNPYLFSGVSFVSDPQPALFYPPTWLALVMPTTRALGLILVLHVWWAAVGATGWLRSEGASWWGALAGAAVFAFSGYTFARVQAGHIGVLTTGVWLPWGLWALRRLARSGDRPQQGSVGDRPQQGIVALGAVCVGMSLLAGHTATFIYVALMMGMYAVYLAWDKGVGWRFLGRATAMGGLGVTLAAVQLLPLFQFLSSSTRLSAPDYEFASRFSWPVGYLLTLLVPNFFGEPVRTGYWGEGVYDELIFYVGVLPLLLAWVAWRVGVGGHKGVGDYKGVDGHKGRPYRFWVAVSGGALLVAFGGYGVMHRLLFRFAPFFSTMRAPARAGFLFTLGAAALTALALTALERAEEHERRRLLAPFGRSWVGGVLGGVALVVAAGYMLFAWGRDSNPAAGRLWHLAGQVATFGLFFALSIGWLRSWLGPGPSRWAPALAAGLVLLDLWTVGAGLVRVVPAPPNAYWRIVSQHTDASAGRVLPWGLDILEQNGALPFRVRSVFGYNPLEDQRYNNFVSAVPDPRARAYDLLNVAYVVTKSPLELAPDDTLSLLAQESGVFLYQRSTAMPRAWMVSELEPVAEGELLARINSLTFDPWQTALVAPGVDCSAGTPGDVTLAQEGENELLFQVSSGGGLAVFSERFAPGWRATIDGEAAALIQVDGVLRGVCVPAGEHLVQFSYRLSSLVWGAVMTFLTMAALVVALARPGRFGRRND